MMLPAPHCSPYDSAHHRDTTPGDTFGNLGTDREYREEDTRAALQIGRRAFYDLAPRREAYPIGYMRAWRERGTSVAVIHD